VSETRPQRLRRELGLFGAVMMGLGAMVGSGVFVSIGSTPASPVLPWSSVYIARAVKMRIDEEGISIPFPQRDVHLIQAAAAERQEPPAAAVRAS
jgi:ABC-type uncharacterized transport system permease subunit